MKNRLTLLCVAWSLVQGPRVWAGTSTWTGPGSDFNTPSNWDSGVPNDIAAFNTVSPTSIFESSFTALNGIVFNPGSAAYSITASSTMSVGVSGIQNKSTALQTFTTLPTFGYLPIGGGSGGAVPISGDLAFINNSTMYIVNDLVTGNVSFTNSNGALAFDRGQLSAGVTVTNQGSIGQNQRQLDFFNGFDGGQSSIINNDLSGWQAGSNADSATITNNGIMRFWDTSTGGNARIINNGILDLTTLNAGMTVGSVEGSGSIELGSKSLTMGSNGLSTEVSGVLSGSGGSVVKVGTGTLTLSETNTYTAGTTISGGTLRIRNDNNLGYSTGTLTFSNGAALQTGVSITSGRAVTLNAGGGTIDTDGSNSTLSGNIGGIGALKKVGVGTLTLSGVNTFAGGTDIEGGILRAGDSNTLPTSHTVTLTDTAGAALDLNGFGQSIGSLSGGGGSGGSVLLGGGTLSTGSDGTSTTYAGVISGTGGSLVKTGTGTFTLSGVNTYTGNTTINGGTLSISNDNNLGGPTATVLLSNNAVLQTGASITSARSIALDFGGGTVDTNGFNSTLFGNISGGAPLTKTGAGTLTITGSNSYFQGTTIAGGTLSINNDNNLGNSAGGVTFSNNGVLQTNTGINSARSISLGIGGGTINTNGFDSVWSGAITGSSTLSKVGAGKLTLTGANASYVGNISIAGGILNIVNDNNLGAPFVTILLSNNAILQTGAAITFNQFMNMGAGGGTIDTNGFDSTLSGGAFGAGALTKTGAGTLTMGPSGQFGGTRIMGGILSIDNDNNLGISGSGLLFSNNAVLQTRSGVTSARIITLTAGGGTVDTNGFNSTFSGNITGAGAFTKTGAGTLTLSGTNSFTGGISIDGGILQAGAQNVLPASGRVSFNNVLATSLNLNGFDQSIGSIAGGGTTGGGINLGNATLSVGNDNTSSTYAGVIGASGGSLIKTGSGNLTLTGSNASVHTAVSGGTLSGTGTLGSVTNNATVAPGVNGVGTLNVASYSGPGTLEIQLKRSSSSSLNVNGTATLTGGTLHITGSNFTPGQFTVLNAGAVANTFSAITTPSSFFIAFNPLYDATSVRLQVSALPFQAAAQTGNQASVAAALDAANASASGDFATALNALRSPNTVDEARAALNQVSGDALASFQQTGFRDASLFTDQMSARSSLVTTALVHEIKPVQVAYNGDLRNLGWQGPPPAEAPSGVWARGIGGTDKIQGNSSLGSPGVDATTSGFQAGYDFIGADDFILGFSGGYSTTGLTVDDRASSGNETAVQSGFYSSYTPGAWAFRESLAYTGAHNEMTRGIAFPGINEQAKANFVSRAYTLFAEGSYSFMPRKSFSLEPAVSLKYSHFTQEGFAETGAPGLDLNVGDETIDSLLSNIGIRLDHVFGVRSPHPFQMGGRVGWQNELLATNNSITARFADAPAGGSFTVQGTSRSRSAAALGLQCRIALSKNLQGVADYSTTLSPNEKTQALWGGLSVRW
jgi:fibronectin-binding autotransporter adhesin